MRRMARSQKVHRPGSRSAAAIHRLVWCGARQPRQPGQARCGRTSRKAVCRQDAERLASFQGGAFAVVERAIHAGAARRRPHGDRP